MKVLHIIAGLGSGGAEATLFRLTVEDKENVHEIVSLTHAGVHGDRLKAAGITVHVLNMPRGRVTIQGLKTLYRLIRRTDPDAVQTWMYHADLIGGVVARLAGHRAITWGVRASDAHRHAKDSSLRTLVWLCARCSRIVPRRIVFNSHAGALVHQRLGYSRAKSRVIPNGYDTARLTIDPAARSAQRAAWNIEPRVKLIGMVARWDSLKDHETLIAALRELGSLTTQEWLCALIGSEMSEANLDLMALLRRDGVFDRVRLLGPASDISAVMNSLDLHVLSSKSEAFPNVLAEAMACGTPCVTTDVGDASTIVGSTGWVVPPSDPRALARALANALDEMADTTLWDRRRAASRRRIVCEFGLPRMAEAYQAVWEEAVGAR